MRSITGRRRIVLPALAAAGLVLGAAPSSHAAGELVTPGPPRVSTGGVAHVAGTSATLQGSVNPRTLATSYYFQYGPTTAYGSQTPTASLPAGTQSVKVKQTVSGLQSGYHYRLVASNADGMNVGKDRTLTIKKKTTKNGFKLPKEFQPTLLGGTFVFSGTLTGTNNVGRRVVLQASPYPYRTPFADVGAPVPTGAGGSFSLRASRLQRSTRFRVATVEKPIVYSLVVPEPVEVRVTLRVRTSKRQKGLVRLYGTVSPAEVGARVFFQLESTPKPKPKPVESVRPEKSGRSERQEERSEKPRFSTKFHAVVKRGTRSLSRFSMIAKVPATGRYRAFVSVPSGPLVSGHSRTVLLHAAAAKSKKKSKGGKKG